MFDDVLFSPRRPLRPSVSSTFAVETVVLSSGAEHRNARTSSPRRTYRLPVGQRPLDELESIMAFFSARGGPLRAFRYRDPFLSDTALSGAGVTASDVSLGVGDGASVEFQLLRRDRVALRKPEANTVRVAVDGLEVAPGTDFTVDHLTGQLAFANAPAAGAAVTAGCRFDMPVRFQNETLTMNQTNAGVGEIDDLLLIEVSQ
ncbi:MAG: TIGR02217 family protein [Pseudomonadota bacterium]